MPENIALSLARECLKSIQSRYPQRSDLEMLNRLIKEKKVKLRDIGIGPKDYVRFDHRIDVMTALNDLQAVLSLQASSSRLVRLRRLIESGKVSLNEIGLRHEEYENLDHRIEVAEAVKLLTALRASPTSSVFNQLVTMIKERRIKPSEIGYTREEADKLSAQIKLRKQQRLQQRDTISS